MKWLLIFLLPNLFGFTIGDTLSYQWEIFKTRHNKTYTNEEESFRKEIFSNNFKLIEDHNQKHDQGMVTYRLEINKYADYTHEELYPSSTVRFGSKTRQAVPKTKTAPESIDWRDYGVITPIVDQGFCFTCWAFAVVAALEAHVGIHLGQKNQTLSEQNLADCVYATFKCKEEMKRTALEDCYRYVVDNGIDSGATYPYENRIDECRFKPENVGAKIKDYVIIPEGDEEEMKQVVGTIGPVSVLITAEHSFTFYRSGVYYNDDWENFEQLYNHAVTVVGYGNENGTDYWLVKNEWSEVFGEKGYIKMARNRNNNCGIASYATYPIL